MEDKKQDRALQTPSEANRDKHMNYLASQEQVANDEVDNDEADNEENEDQRFREHIRNKHDADSGNEGSTNEMLQKENLIDPGNEHNHLKGSQNRDEDYRPGKFDAEAGSDATGTTGTKPE